MEYTEIDLEVRHGAVNNGQHAIAILTLNRPDTLNAITPTMSLELDAAMNEIRRNPVIQTVILTGAGDGFCSGGDLHEEGSVLGVTEIDSGLRGPYKKLAEYALNDLYHHYMQQYGRKFENLPQVTIAAINGWAVGAGLELATLADIRIASDRAKFTEPAVKQGFLSETGGTRNLPKLLGKGRALEMILTGDAIDATTAEEWGLVDHVVEHDTLLNAAIELAERIGRLPHLSVLHGKELVRRYWTTDSSPEGWKAELDAIAEIYRTKDNQEGIRAFIEKRGTNFEGPGYSAYNK